MPHSFALVWPLGEQAPSLLLFADIFCYFFQIRQRNDHAGSIVTHLQLGERGVDAMSQSHYVFFLGDLNYRIGETCFKGCFPLKSTKSIQDLCSSMWEVSN